MSNNIELSEKIKELMKNVPIENDYLIGLIEDIIKKGDELELKLGGNIVVGLDVNGPIVATDDNNLMPFQGATECIKNMMNTITLIIISPRTSSWIVGARNGDYKGIHPYIQALPNDDPGWEKFSGLNYHVVRIFGSLKILTRTSSLN